MSHYRYALSSAMYAPESAPILLKGPICNNLQSAGKLGYDAIEIHMRETDPIDIPSVLKTMEETHVRISMVITGRLNTEGGCSLLDDRPYITTAAIDGAKQYIDLASALGADLVVGWLIGNIPTGALCKERYLDRLANNLRVLCEYGIKKQVRINVEIINHYEVNVFTTVKSLIDFKKKYQLENLYVHLDTFHMNIDEDSFEDAIKLAGKDIGYVHLADNHRRYPGSGMIDFKNILNQLRSVGYTGYLSVECFPVPSGTEAARQALLYMRTIDPLS